ncbi:MAG: hypothetical protein AAF718_12915 [Pseudomonadota bacterium]
MRNLPSIPAAERTYAAAVAELGVREASFLPSVTLFGEISGVKNDSWSFGRRVSLPLFNQGAQCANREVQVAVIDEADAECITRPAQ